MNRRGSKPGSHCRAGPQRSVPEADLGMSARLAHGPSAAQIARANPGPRNTIDAAPMNTAITIQGTEQVRVAAAPSADDNRSALAGVNNRPIESSRDCGAPWRTMAAAALWSNAAVAHAMAPAVSHVVATIVFARVRGCPKGAI